MSRSPSTLPRHPRHLDTGVNRHSLDTPSTLSRHRRHRRHLDTPGLNFARFDCYEGTALPVVTWYEAPDHGTRLTRGQVEALLLLVHAGEQQILNFQQEQDEIERLEGRA